MGEPPDGHINTVKTEIQLNVTTLDSPKLSLHEASSLTSSPSTVSGGATDTFLSLISLKAGSIQDIDKYVLIFNREKSKGEFIYIFMAK